MNNGGDSIDGDASSSSSIDDDRRKIPRAAEGEGVNGAVISIFRFLELLENDDSTTSNGEED